MYWHGLGHCGDPSEETEIFTRKEREARGQTYREPFRTDEPEDTQDYVHASPSAEVALAFSTLSHGHAVCEIDPGELPAERDPDFPTLSVRFAGTVKIVSTTLFDTTALPSARQIVKTLSSDYRHDDGTPRYRPDGYLRTPPAGHLYGYTDPDFQWLGPWYPLEFLWLGDDGRATAVTDDASLYQMFPPHYPHLAGRRRIPHGTLTHAWNEPGYHPAGKTQMLLAQARTWQPDFSAVMPWDW